MRILRMLFLILPIMPAIFAGAQPSWHKTFQGQIATDSVTIQLHKAGHQYFGYYYFKSKSSLIYFIGEDTTDKQHVVLSPFLPDPEATENFLLSISDESLSGQWKSKSDSAVFTARAVRTPIMFNFVYAEGTAQLRPKMKESPAATYLAASVWPTGTAPQLNFLKKKINEEFNTKNSTEEIGKIFVRQKKQFFDGYLKDNKDLKQEEIEEVSMYNLDESDQLLVAFQSAKLITLAHYSYSYSGGAHGNYGTTYIPLSLPGGKELKIDDILVPAGKKKLPALLEKYFRKIYSLSDNDPLSDGGLFNDDIKASNNFYVTTNGIGFNYLPYEIGPFALGEINIFIPFSELAAFLQPAFKKLIQ